MCDVLNVKRSTYYYQLNRCKNDVKKADDVALSNEIERIFKMSRNNYGTRKIQKELVKLIEPKHVSRRRIGRLMRDNAWQCIVKKKKYHQKPGKSAIIAENKLKRTFMAEKPRQKLVTDITYLPFGNKLFYLSTIMDVFNREIIAYTIGDKQDIAFVLDTLNQVEDLPSGCLLHSDQGSVYTSHEYQQAVKEKGIIMSMPQESVRQI